ncbi:hypothetical protein IG3_05962 [Bacillus cereus HuA2-1]|uniref:Uncharacterized protein n=1 Tax=Bacillus cereus HuA2-1 TaxID=1053201 RepID=J9BJG4_BACCE|nr:hypothetical protein IG3_05962 [Bacillus cereus HuA2-1]
MKIGKKLATSVLALSLSIGTFASWFWCKKYNTCAMNL